jgi:hypothetical protein
MGVVAAIRRRAARVAGSAGWEAERRGPVTRGTAKSPFGAVERQEARTAFHGFELAHAVHTDSRPGTRDASAAPLAQRNRSTADGPGGRLDADRAALALAALAVGAVRLSIATNRAVAVLIRTAGEVDAGLSDVRKRLTGLRTLLTCAHPLVALALAHQEHEGLLDVTRASDRNEPGEHAVAFG